MADSVGGDGSSLLSYEGFVVVRSHARADVYVQGVLAGPTNTKLKSRCYTRNVRLREAGSGRWLTAGQPVVIACMSTTTVVIEPK